MDTYLGNIRDCGAEGERSGRSNEATDVGRWAGVRRMNGVIATKQGYQTDGGSNEDADGSGVAR